MSERKKLPYWIENVWKKDADGWYVNPYGIKHRNCKNTTIIIGETGLNYTDIECGELVFCSVCEDKDGFYGKENGRLRFNEYDELVGEVSCSIDEDCYVDGSENAIFAYLSTAITSQPYYESFLENGVLMKKEYAFNMLKMFVEKKHKMIPLLIQEGFFYVIEDMFEGRNTDVLKINRSVISIAKTCNIRIQNAIPLSMFNTGEVEKFYKFVAYFINDRGMVQFCMNLVSNTQIEDFTKFANYIVKSFLVYGTTDLMKGCYERTLREFLSMYKDYISLIEDEPVKDLYPEDLKAAHDAAVDRTYIVSEGVRYNIAEFRKATRKYDHLAWEDGEISVLVPLSPIDLINESMEMHNCVRGYINSVMAGNTNILLMRMGGKPYMTIEVNDTCIVQAKRKCNAYPGYEDMEVLQKYANSRNLKIKQL